MILARIASTNARCGLLLQVSWHSMVCLSVLVTMVSPAKTAQPIEMPFGGQTLENLTNRELDGIDLGAT